MLGRAIIINLDNNNGESAKRGNVPRSTFNGGNAASLEGQGEGEGATG